MFFYKKELGNLFPLNFSLITFNFFRFQQFKKLFICRLNQILLFYKVYKNFTLKLKKMFILHLLNNFLKQISFLFNVKNSIIQLNAVTNLQNFCLFWVINKKSFYIKFSFIHLFLCLDFLREFYFNSVFNLYYFFQIFAKTFIKHEQNALFFQNILYITYIYLCIFETYLSQLKNSIFIKNFSDWKILSTNYFNSFLFYLCSHSKYILYYIRCSHILYLYLCCKIKYVLQIYRNFVIILKTNLKLPLKYFDFNIHLTRRKNFCYNIYNFSNLKIRLYFLLLLNYNLLENKNIRKKNTNYIKKKSLFIIILQSLLEYLSVFKFKNSFLYKIIFFINKFL